MPAGVAGERKSPLVQLTFAYLTLINVAQFLMHKVRHERSDDAGTVN
jgi:hypothetical protein